LSEVIGRKITHKKLTLENFQQALQGFGIEEKYAGMVAYIDVQTAAGIQEDITKTPGVFVGKRTLLDYFKANKDIWIKA
jgi:festuclavine dehydrogenase